ncbi:MAG TPA: thiopurine S-methyltransferase [Terriglobia bacterium]|nr:thiopurine S-methyltransferase [Terriglobia bacterium]
MNHDFWLNRWQENRIGFHLPEVNPHLKRFYDETIPRSARILAPLCGKSVDLRWLADKGHDVVGVELSSIAAAAFMREQGLTAETSTEPPFTVFRADRITFLVGDFFDLTPENAGRFDLIYDRAALIALSPDVRPRYVARLGSLLNPGGRALLISLEYDPQSMNGPPFAVREDEIRSLYDGYEVRKLLEYDCLENEPQFRQRGLQWMKEAVYRIDST